jgi:hypothetical protein
MYTFDQKQHVPHNIFRLIGWFIIGISLAIVFAGVFAIVVQYLWNWLMTEIFKLGNITFWQAFGLVLLAKILFSGFGHRHSDRGHERFFDRRKRADRSSLPESIRNNWDQYQEFWEQEGEKAFDEYLKRIGK